MSAIHEYDSLKALLAGAEVGYVILHQEPALGNEHRGGQEQMASALAQRFAGFRDSLVQQIGEPSESAEEWDLGIPTWASGGGYALWQQDDDFVSLFVSWDNPEDPSFVVAARAAMSQLSREPGAADPWSQSWMRHGEW